MKVSKLIRTLLFGLLAMILLSRIGLPQTPAGYNGLRWNSLVDEVKKVFPDLYQVRGDPSTSYFSQPDSAGFIGLEFQFRNGGLWNVIEVWKTDINPKWIIQQLMKIYGKDFYDSVEGGFVRKLRLVWGNLDTTAVVFTQTTYGRSNKVEGLEVRVFSKPVQIEINKETGVTFFKFE